MSRQVAKIGTIIEVAFVELVCKEASASGHYWLEVPEGMTKEGALEQALDTNTLHGPFGSEREAEEDFENGLDYPISDGGECSSIEELRARLLRPN
jgi:hypothetical protein